jgi:hypothetical protein
MVFWTLDSSQYSTNLNSKLTRLGGAPILRLYASATRRTIYYRDKRQCRVARG